MFVGGMEVMGGGRRKKAAAAATAAAKLSTAGRDALSCTCRLDTARGGLRLRVTPAAPQIESSAAHESQPLCPD